MTKTQQRFIERLIKEQQQREQHQQVIIKALELTTVNKIRGDKHNE